MTFDSENILDKRGNDHAVSIKAIYFESDLVVD